MQAIRQSFVLVATAALVQDVPVVALAAHKGEGGSRECFSLFLIGKHFNILIDQYLTYSRPPAINWFNQTLKDLPELSKFLYLN